MRYKQCLSDQTLENRENPAAMRILDAAYQLFLEKGYAAVTMREIARVAGVNLGLLPYYYGSKEKLAQIVFQKIKDSAFTRTNAISLRTLGSAERMYVQTMLGWASMTKVESEAALRFYYEFLTESRGNYYVSDSFEELSWAVIREYKCNVTLGENEAYLTAVAGAEQMLVLRSVRNEIRMEYEDILDLVISNYLYNIGLSDQTIAAIISRSKGFLDQIQGQV